MNRNQRERNRLNAAWLYDNTFICPECGGRGRHYLVANDYESATDAHMAGQYYLPVHGFYICANKYGPDGRRIQGA
jgi:hypothetical protein